MEKWQERLIPGQHIEEPGQGVTGVMVEGEPAALAQAEETARRTRELLSTRGWCMWKCSTLGGDIIAVVRDENVEGVPEEYPVYTQVELEQLCRADINEATLRLVHEAKKLAGANVVSVESKKEQ